MTHQNASSTATGTESFDHNDLLAPHLTVEPAAEAIEFYKRAFDFKEMNRLVMPDGKVIHCHLNRGRQVLMLADAFPGMGDHCCKSPRGLGGTTVTIHLGVADVDAAFKQAVAAGATILMPLENMFWGARYGQLLDPFGHHWSLATQMETLTHDQIRQRAMSMFAARQPR